MTQPEQAVEAATDEPIIAAEPTVEDRLSALMEDQQDEQPLEEQPEGELPEGETPEGEHDAEAEAETPIQAPASWPDEDKAAFAELPRALQERVTARESEREKFLQAKSREAAATRNAVEQEAQQRISQLQQLHTQALQAVLPPIPDEPSPHMIATDPHTYAYLVEARNNVLAQYEQAGRVVQETAQYIEQAKQQHAQAEIMASVEVLKAEFPEFLDEAKRPDIVKNIEATGAALGYSPDMMSRVDATDILALRTANEWRTKAEKFDALMAKQMEQVRSAKNLPKVSRPGTALAKGQASNEAYQRDREAMRGGDKDAAARAIARFL